MTIDANLISAISAVVVAFLSVIGAVAAVWWQLAKDIQAIRDDLGAYKTEVAKDYASIGAVREVENRLVDAVTALTGRIDTLIMMLQKQGVH